MATRKQDAPAFDGRDFAAGLPPVLTLAYDAQAAMSDDPEQSALREVSLSLDVAQVARGEQPLPDVDTTIDIPIDAHIPPEYIGNEVQRLYAYRRIADIRSEADVLDVREELLDRYGELPPPVENLFLCALVKSLGQQAGLATVTVREGSAKLIYGESAAIDGGKLLSALSAQQGARLLATAPPGIIVQLPKADAAEIAKRLLPFLAAVSACAD